MKKEESKMKKIEVTNASFYCKSK